MSLIEIHVLQNFSPSNLNRDDTGSPKDCEFGGVRRARISSQCQKRAIRRYFAASELLSAEELGVRTKRASEAIAERLVQLGKPPAEAAAVAQVAIQALGIGADKKRPALTGYLIYVSKSELDNLAGWTNENWELLTAAVAAKAAKAEKKDNSKKTNAAGKADQELKAKLNGKCAADLALFGRMLADLQDDSVDAATQVAHAISTHRVSVDFDYYTAVDDLKPTDTAAADMVGTVEFNSACYYRYGNVNLEVLRDNLDGDKELAQRSLEAFIRGFARAIPTGKQNSMAAHNPPSFLLAVRRTSGPCNLANAFIKPVQQRSEQSLIAASVKALDDYWGRLCAKFGKDGIEDVVAWSFDDDQLASIETSQLANTFDNFVLRACKTFTTESVA
jgi:CRISPR system Cascade subunit CasC